MTGEEEDGDGPVLAPQLARVEVDVARDVEPRDLAARPAGRPSGRGRPAVAAVAIGGSGDEREGPGRYIAVL